MGFATTSELFRYWRRFPPEHLLLRAFVGYESPDERSVRPETIRAEQNFAKLARAQTDNKRGVIPADKLPAHVKKFILEEYGPDGKQSSSN